MKKLSVCKPSMKHHEILFSIFKIPLDFLIVFGSFFLAREIRQITDLIPWVYLPTQTLSNESLTIFAMFWGLLYIALFALHRLYSLQMSHSKIQEILDVLRYSIYWFVFFAVGVYLGNGIIYNGEEIPRLIILFTMILAALGSSILRISLNGFQSVLLRNNKLSPRNILLITNTPGDDIAPLIDDIHSSNIYHILGYANTQPIEPALVEYIWGIQELKSYFENRDIDEILYINSDFTTQERYQIWELSRIYGVRYRYITNNFDVTRSNTFLSMIYQTPVIEIQNTPLENWGRVWKRIVDIFFSLWILIFLSPLYLLIAALIKLEDPAGPAIYKNRRIGQSGNIFNCYKFRYLKWEHCIKESYGVDNKDDPAIQLEKELISKNNGRSWPLYKIQNDPRKTRIGAFLEKYSLDELPQFFNVLKGEMSIVGPRPHQPREVEQYELYQQRLLTIKPGITGMAQVNGREQNNFEKEAKLDIFYIENWNFLLDFKIMWKTLSIILARR